MGGRESAAGAVGLFEGFDFEGGAAGGVLVALAGDLDAGAGWKVGGVSGEEIGLWVVAFGAELEAGGGGGCAAGDAGVAKDELDDDADDGAGADDGTVDLGSAGADAEAVVCPGEPGGCEGEKAGEEGGKEAGANAGHGAAFLGRKNDWVFGDELILLGVVVAGQGKSASGGGRQ